MKISVLNLFLVSSLAAGLWTIAEPLVFSSGLLQPTEKKSFIPWQTPVIKEIDPSGNTGSSRAVVVEQVPLAHTTQIFPLNQKGELVGNGDVVKQINQIFTNLALMLKEANASANNLVKLNIYLAQTDLLPQVQAQLARKFKSGPKPAVSFVVGDLAQPGALVALDAIAPIAKITDNKAVKYSRSTSLNHPSAAAHVAVLPAGGVVYVSGQADKGALAEATRGTLQQLAATLAHLGLRPEDVVQLKAFTQPVTEAGVVENEFKQFFKGKTLPPIVYVDWESKSPVVEIELIAAAPITSAQATQQIEFITPPFMTASPVYSKVTRINRGKKVYVSGLYGKTVADAQAEVSEIFSSLKDILQKAGSNFNYLAKATYYVSDDKSSTQLNEQRPKYYDPKRPPAASKAQVKGVGFTGKGVTVDMIGVVAE